MHVKAGAPCAAKPPLTLMVPPPGTPGHTPGATPGAGHCPLPPRMAHSLPRRKASTGDEFGRNGPGRRSAGPGGGRLSPEPLMEYFVPRSVSEFNLAGVVAEEDESALVVPEPPGPPKCPAPPGPPGMHHPHQLTAILRTPGGPGSRKLGMASSRSREKMVTFEDEPAGPGPVPGPCPGQCPRGMDDVFM